MRPTFRSCFVTSAVLALALTTGGTAYAARAAGPATLARPGATADDAAPAFPARPAGARDLPPSRVRITSDVTWGVADPRAVEAFRNAPGP